MRILGVSSFFHDSSAAVIVNGEVRAAADEERFTRKKHDNGFPSRAIDFCLSHEKIQPHDIDAIAYYEKPIRKFERVISQHVTYFPKSIGTFIHSMPSWWKEKLRVTSYVSRKKLSGEMFFIPHHLCHAAASFFTSSFPSAAIVTIDGVGEWTTTSVGIGEDKTIRLVHEIRFPHSLGLLYSTVTAHLGFSVNNSEYKVMGLSAYGEKDRTKNQIYKKLRTVIDRKKDGSFALNMEYFAYPYKNRMPSQRFIEVFGPIRKKKEQIGTREKDIAAAVQLITEDIYFSILNYAHKLTKKSVVCIGGGVALNSVANGKILAKTPFRDVCIHPSAGDSGTSVGAALFTYHSLFGKNRTKSCPHAFLGSEYSNEEIVEYFASEHVVYQTFQSHRDLIKTVADLLWGNAVIGWFQGRMEWGPRALGARSILANPLNPDMKRILNEKVKHREIFRPFAPVVCRKDAAKYFEIDIPIPSPCDYMLMVYPVRKQFREKLPAITHVDGTARVQTIQKHANELLHDLIQEFGKKSGIPMLVNTSFNIRSEPIVESPRDAYVCMMGTGIDYLAIGNILVKRGNNLKHAWESERYIPSVKMSGFSLY